MPVTEERANMHKRDENVLFTALHNASRKTTAVLAEGLVLSTITQSTIRSSCRKAVFSELKITDFSFT